MTSLSAFTLCLRYYCQPLAFHRLLNLLANEVVAKAKDIIGDNLLTDPLKVYMNERSMMYMYVRTCSDGSQ